MVDGWIELAATLAPNAYDKIKKVLMEKNADSSKVNVLVSMMIYDQNEKVLNLLQENDGRMNTLQDTVDDQSEQLQKIMTVVRKRSTRNSH